MYDVPYSYSKGLGIRAYEFLCFDIPVSREPDFSDPYLVG